MNDAVELASIPCGMSIVTGANRLATNRRVEPATEQALIEQCRRQDFDAFGKIVDLYQARVLGFIRKMVRGQEEALDLTQEVFIKAYQGFARFDGRSSLRTWLFRIAYNLCVDRSRKNDRAPDEIALDGQSDDNPIEISDSRWNPEAFVMDQELQSVVNVGLETMSEKLRGVLLMHDREDMGYDDIAAAMGIPVGTVKSRLFLARSHLQQHLLRYWNGERRS